MGTGPFILKSWVARDRLVLERNPNYWLSGYPHLNKVVLRPLPDAQARFASLEAGETDIIWDDNFDNIEKAKKDKSLVVYEYTGSGAAVAAFNTKLTLFDDLHVRQALVMATSVKTRWAARGRASNPIVAGLTVFGTKCVPGIVASFGPRIVALILLPVGANIWPIRQPIQPNLATERRGYCLGDRRALQRSTRLRKL